MISIICYVHDDEKSVFRKLEKIENLAVKYIGENSDLGSRDVPGAATAGAELNYEMIVVDDFSDDKSFDQISNYIKIKKAKYIKLLRQDEYRGRGRAFQWALGSCNGEIVVFVNSKSEKNKFEKIHKIVNSEIDAYVNRDFGIYRSDKIKNIWLKQNGELIEAEIIDNFMFQNYAKIEFKHICPCKRIYIKIRNSFKSKKKRYKNI